MRAAAGGPGGARRPVPDRVVPGHHRLAVRPAAGADREDARERRLVHPWSSPGELTTEATVKVHVGDERVVATAEGNGPVNALDAALRLAIEPHFRAAAQRAPHRLPSARASTRPRGPGPSRGCCSTPPTPRAAGRRSACRRTSSRRRGRRSSTPSCSASSGPPRVEGGDAATAGSGADEAALPVGATIEAHVDDPAQVRPHHRAARGSRGAAARRAGAMDAAPARENIARARNSREQAGLGIPGPDQGYALELAKRFADRLVLEPGEHARTCSPAPSPSPCAGRRCSGGRPVAADIELALELFGYLAGEARRPRASLWSSGVDSLPEPPTTTGAAAALADEVPEETLRLTPAGCQANGSIADAWRLARARSWRLTMIRRSIFLRTRPSSAGCCGASATRRSRPVPPSTTSSETVPVGELPRLRGDGAAGARDARRSTGARRRCRDAGRRDRGGGACVRLDERDAAHLEARDDPRHELRQRGAEAPLSAQRSRAGRRRRATACPSPTPARTSPG